MIPAPPGLVAIFKGNLDIDISRRVVAFNDDGEALYCDETGRLAVAIETSNFVRIDQDEFPEDGWVALIPSGGWKVTLPCLTTEGKEASTTEPIVGWGITRQGSVRALVRSDNDFVDSVESRYGDAYIFHPDEDFSPAEPHKRGMRKANAHQE